jgi:UDP-N-acetylglucosamine--N-acetylmuramyl-(pentapeptide) pyrophosphoryl-undecaprenol N-acetylglucosamine transferase
VKALIASSATGGHLYPALAVAERIKRRDGGARILFVGARYEIGKDIVGAAGFEQTAIDVTGFDRRRPLRNVETARNLIRSGAQIRGIFGAFQPDVVFGTGGYVCGPVIREAKKAGIPAYIQEQNVIPGLANKMAEKYADKVFLAFEASAGHFRGKGKLLITGNPIRDAFLTAGQADCRAKLGIADGDTALLIFGGSQGADAINKAAMDVALRFGGREGFHIFFLTGKDLYRQTCEGLARLFAERPAGVHVMGYTDTIHEYFAAADLIVARSGALTVSEIAVSGKASVLIPSPNVTNNHQYFNAKVLADAGAAIILNEADAAGLSDVIEELTADRARLSEMGENARKVARPDAADVIIDEIYGRKQA